MDLPGRHPDRAVVESTSNAPVSSRSTATPRAMAPPTVIASTCRPRVSDTARQRDRISDGCPSTSARSRRRKATSSASGIDVADRPRAGDVIRRLEVHTDPDDDGASRLPRLRLREDAADLLPIGQEVVGPLAPESAAETSAIASAMATPAARSTRPMRSGSHGGRSTTLHSSGGAGPVQPGPAEPPATGGLVAGSDERPGGRSLGRERERGRVRRPGHVVPSDGGGQPRSAQRSRSASSFSTCPPTSTLYRCATWRGSRSS